MAKLSPPPVTIQLFNGSLETIFVSQLGGGLRREP
jgi:hypothetical protein